VCIAAVAAAEVFAEVLTEILAEILIEILGGMELEVLLVAICCWDSLKSYTSFSAQSLVKSICALFLC
jgi:hypothetical protein